MDDDDRMDLEIAQLNQRLTSLETEFAVQNEAAAVERASYARKEDILRIEVLLANCATKQDVARIDASLTETKIDVARIDAVLDSIQKNYATKADLLHVETQLTRMETHIAQQSAQMVTQLAQMGTQLAQMGTQFAQIGTQFAQMDVRMAQMEARMARWMFATLITVIGIASTVTFTIIKLTQ